MLISCINAENIDNNRSKKELRLKLNDIDKELEGNIWITRYENYLTYRQIEKELKKIKKEAKKYSKWKSERYEELSYQLYNKIKIKENELELISEYKNSPIGKQITPIIITKAPNISNPFIIIEALSYIKKLNENKTLYAQVNEQLNELLSIFKFTINIL